MSITVVGSIAYDTVTTPFGVRERMLGGAAVHFALAASFFDDVCVVGPVGEDFGEEQLEVMRSRGVDVSGIERVAGGRTFFWQGEYGWDLNSRETIDTQLGVFEGFQPKLTPSPWPPTSCSSPTSSPICSARSASSCPTRASWRSTR